MLGKNGNKTDWKNMALATMARGNALDAYFTLKVFKKLSPKLSKLGMDNIYGKMMVPAVTFFKNMELDGLLISSEKVKSLGVLLKDDIDNKEDSLYSFKEVKQVIALSKDAIEVTSTDDLTQILFSCDKKKNLQPGGFHLYPPICSDKTNAPSTSVEALDILLEQLEEEINRRGLNEQV